jgi:hypothetical protein
MWSARVPYWEAAVTELGDNQNEIFVTTAMAEILLNQHMLTEARRVIEQLLENEPENPRHIALEHRLQAMVRHGEREPKPIPSRDQDFIALKLSPNTLQMDWELKEESIALAQRKARYGGQNVVRLFSAVSGPRGVRTSTRDIAIGVGAAHIEITGLPCPAVHVAAAGFLSKTGEFVPLAESEPIVQSDEISNKTT